MHQNNILNDLIVGEAYTERQISHFITSNKHVVVMGDESNYFNGSVDTKYKVIKSYEKFLHQQHKESGSYMIPNTKTKFYIIEKL